MKSPNIEQEAEEILKKSQTNVFNDFNINYKSRQTEINFGIKIEKYFQKFFPGAKIIKCTRKKEY